ncbi:MAG: glycoside hydrolase family 3 N-terminal domain-containing protein [Phycisphaerales bacterium JB039]
MSSKHIEHLAGRRLMVGIRGAGPDDTAFRQDLDACREARVGGIILFDVDVPQMRAAMARGARADEARTQATRNITSPAQLRELTGLLRDALGPDLLIAIDQEGGAVARLNPSRGFAATPSAAEFARLAPDAQVAAADALAGAVADAGIDINFAPCVDLALNPDSDVIAGAGRAFSADPEVVITCARRIIDAHARAGVTTCLKHFPGHGSARADSHESLPDITDSHQPELELAPYRALLGYPPTPWGARGYPPTPWGASGYPPTPWGARSTSPHPAEAPPRSVGAPMVMTGHLLHRALDPHLPASLSPAITTGLLRNQLGFGGVIITDSLDMRAIRDRFSAAEAAILALRAGADIALDGHNLTADRPCEAVALRDAIARAARDGALDPEALAASAARADRLCGNRGR